MCVDPKKSLRIRGKRRNVPKFKVEGPRPIEGQVPDDSAQYHGTCHMSDMDMIADDKPHHAHSK